MKEKLSVQLWVVIVVLLAVVIFYAPHHQVSGQSDFAVWAQITDFDYSEFPEVIVQTIVRSGNNEPVKISDLAGYKLLENGNEVFFDTEEVAAGVETIFVVDFGAGMGTASTSGVTRREEVLEILRKMIGDKSKEDTFALILVKPFGEVQVLHPISDDTSALLAAVDEIPELSNTISAGSDGIARALQELQASKAAPAVEQCIVFISPGIQDYVAGVPIIIQQARSLKIPVHTVLVNLNEESAELLIEIADGTGGIFLQYSNINSIDPIIAWNLAQGTQTKFAFRSSKSTDTERMIELRSASGALLDSVNYQVSLKPPIVIIDLPVSGTVYHREAETYNSDIERIKPISTEIVVHVEWPDGFPRKIEAGQFYVNGISDGSPYAALDKEGMIFIWNLRPYRTRGESQALIRVDVKDELGLTGVAVPVPVMVSVTIPQPPAPDISVDPCGVYAGDGGFARIQSMLCQLKPYVVWLSLIAALIALFVASLFREDIVNFVVRAVNSAADSIHRVFNPGDTDEVGAYFHVLEGGAMADKTIPLYTDKITLIGRELLQSKIGFRAESELRMISENHCQVIENNGEFRIWDSGSVHGTFVNTVRVPEDDLGILLTYGDKISLGPVMGGVRMMFRESTTRTVRTSIESYPTFEEMSQAGETIRFRFHRHEVNSAGNADAIVDYGMDFVGNEDDN
jgi:hypothetical protein